MSLKASCPELDQLIQTYYELGTPNHAVQLDQLEQKLETCLAEERTTRKDPYPERPNAVLQTSDTSVYQIQGGDHVPYEPNYEEVDYTPSSSPNPETFYIYVKRDPCPYLEKARHLLHSFLVEERPFTDDQVGMHALPDHAAILESEPQPLSSPQIFHGARYIPGGAEGLEQYLGPNAQNEVDSELKVQSGTQLAMPLNVKVATPPKSAESFKPPSIVSPTTFKYRYVAPSTEPTPQVKVDWFVYGSRKCPHCITAMNILGPSAEFIELYRYNPTTAKPFTHIHPQHAQLVGPEKAQTLAHEIPHIRDSQGVPLIYYKSRRVPNDFKKLPVLLREWRD